METDRQARIRERAYRIWDEENRPDGKHDEHWRRAEREIAEEEGSQSIPMPGATSPRRAAASGVPEGSDKPAARPRGDRANAPLASQAQPATASNSPAQSEPAGSAAKPPARRARPAAKTGSGPRRGRQSGAGNPSP